MIKPVYLFWGIVLTAFFLYFKTFYNGFVGDDMGYINHPYIQNFQIVKLFQSSTADLGGSAPITGQFFRPLMLVNFAFIYKLAGSSAFLYHFIQFLFHLINVFLLYFIFRKFFPKIYSYVASLLYLIHPINIEAVAYISDFQDVQFVFFGLLALTLLIYKSKLKQTHLVVPLFLFFALLSKETAILFVGILLLYTLIYKKNCFGKELLSYSIPVFLYTILRFVVAGVGVGKVPHTVFGDMNFSERIIQIPSIVLYYFKTLIFPKDLVIAQTWTVNANSSNMLAAILTILLLVLMLIFFTYQQRGNKKVLLPFVFFFSWFFAGMLLHLQLLPLEMTAADRWFYFPFIGLLGITGSFINAIKHKPVKTLVLAILILSFPLLFARTFIRLSDFKNPITLYSHDAKITQSYILEHSLGYELMQENKLNKSLPHLVTSVKLFPTSSNTNTLGVYFYKKNDTDNALIWFQRSITLGDNFLAYNNTSRIYLAKHDYENAQKILTKAVEKFPRSDTFWHLLSITEYKLENTSEALAAAEKAFSLSQSQQNFYVVNQLRQGLPLIIHD